MQPHRLRAMQPHRPEGDAATPAEDDARLRLISHGSEQSLRGADSMDWTEDKLFQSMRKLPGSIPAGSLETPAEADPLASSEPRRRVSPAAPGFSGQADDAETSPVKQG